MFWNVAVTPLSHQFRLNTWPEPTMTLLEVLYLYRLNASLARHLWGGGGYLRTMGLLLGARTLSLNGTLLPCSKGQRCLTCRVVLRESLDVHRRLS